MLDKGTEARDGVDDVSISAIKWKAGVPGNETSRYEGFIPC